MVVLAGPDRLRARPGIDYEPLAAGRAARDAPTVVLAIPGSGLRIEAVTGASGPGRMEAESLSRRAPRW